MAECSHYYRRVIDALVQHGVSRPEETFWAGVFVGICEQVMMKVKPAGMMGSEMPRCEEICRIVAETYGLHWTRLDRPGSDTFEVWVCRRDDRATIEELARLRRGGMSWAEYHTLRGKLCGYSDDLIRAYTEGTWP